MVIGLELLRLLDPLIRSKHTFLTSKSLIPWLPRREPEYFLRQDYNYDKAL